MIIKEVNAREIYDSRGQSTIEVVVNGQVASAPSGKSTGKYETSQYHKSISWNIDFLNNWNQELEINSFDDLTTIEAAIKKKAKLKDVKQFGANALFAFESAVLKALAHEQKKPLWQIVNSHVTKFPRPVGNAIGGGMHSEQFNVHPVFQEFLLIPNEKTFAKNVEIMQSIYNELGKKLKAHSTNDEGAWHAPIDDEEALKLLSQYAKKIDIGVDIAASSFYHDNLYMYHHELDRTAPNHIEHILSLIKRYGVFYVEDPVQEEDFAGFSQLKKQARESIIVGDDLTATHSERVQKAISSRSISALIVKPNQNGSLLEVKRIIELCKKHNIHTVMSHRSGETMDNALADYAFGFQCDFIKCGIATEWREAKLKRMIEIESSI